MAPESWEAYQVDLATHQVGMWIENQLAERDKKGKPVHRLADLLAEPDPTAPAPGFAPLAGRVIKKMQVPDSGIW